MIVTKFLVTRELIKLARWLRVLGYDTTVSQTNNSKKLRQLCQLQNRILIIRIRKPGKLGDKNHVIIINSDKLAEQLRQMITELHINVSSVFSRCLDCNRKVYAIKKTAILTRLPEKVRQKEEHFTICRKCGKIFWHGTHYQAMLQFLYRELDGVLKKEEAEFTLTDSD